MQNDIIKVITVKVTLPATVSKELASAVATLSMRHAEKYQDIFASQSVYTLGNVIITKTGAPFMDEIEMQDFAVEFNFFKDLIK